MDPKLEIMDRVAIALDTILPQGSRYLLFCIPPNQKDLIKITSNMNKDDAEKFMRHLGEKYSDGKGPIYKGVT
jgi:hypothetical protein